MSQAGIASDSSSPAADVETLTGNSGGAVGPTGIPGNINVLGNTTQGITIAGNPGTSTLTASFSASTTQDFAFLDQLNVGAVLPTLNYDFNIENDVNGPIGMSIYNPNVGASARVEAVLRNAGTDDIQIQFVPASGQQWTVGSDQSASDAFTISKGLILGTTNALSINWTTRAITFDGAYTFPVADGSAGQVLTTNGAGALTFSPNTTLAWNVIGASQGLAVNNGYMCTSGAGLTLDLPAVSAVGDVIRVTLDGATSWTITQPNAATRIRIGNTQTTLGVGGSLASTAVGDCVELVCQTANARWQVTSMIGNITVV